MATTTPWTRRALAGAIAAVLLAFGIAVHPAAAVGEVGSPNSLTVYGWNGSGPYPATPGEALMISVYPWISCNPADWQTAETATSTSLMSVGDTITVNVSVTMDNVTTTLNPSAFTISGPNVNTTGSNSYQFSSCGSNPADVGITSRWAGLPTTSDSITVATLIKVTHGGQDIVLYDSANSTDVFTAHSANSYSVLNLSTTISTPYSTSVTQSAVVNGFARNPMPVNPNRLTARAGTDAVYASFRYCIDLSASPAGTAVTAAVTARNITQNSSSLQVNAMNGNISWNSANSQPGNNPTYTIPAGATWVSVSANQLFDRTLNQQTNWTVGDVIEFQMTLLNASNAAVAATGPQSGYTCTGATPQPTPPSSSSPTVAPVVQIRTDIPFVNLSAVSTVSNSNRVKLAGGKFSEVKSLSIGGKAVDTFTVNANEELEFTLPSGMSGEQEVQLNGVDSVLSFRMNTTPSMSLSAPKPRAVMTKSPALTRAGSKLQVSSGTWSGIKQQQQRVYVCSTQIWAGVGEVAPSGCVATTPSASDTAQSVAIRRIWRGKYVLLVDTVTDMDGVKRTSWSNGVRI